MTAEETIIKQPKGLNVFEKYLTIWVLLCIAGGIVLGKAAPQFAKFLDGIAIYVNNAPVVSIPIAVCLFFMMYPIMVKIDFAEVLKAGKSIKPVGLTLFVNWAIKPFTMYAIALFFLGTLFYSFIGPDAIDHVKIPFGLNLDVGATHGVGKVVLVEGVKMLEVPLWRSYFWGCILLGIAPCTAMVLVWGYLAKGNDGHTLVMVAINSLTMLLLFGPLGGFLLGMGKLPVPWQALLLSVAIYVAFPLVAGYFSRKWIVTVKGKERPWLEDKLMPMIIILLYMQGHIQGQPILIYVALLLVGAWYILRTWFEAMLLPISIVLLVVLVRPISIYVVLLFLVAVLYILQKWIIKLKGKVRQWFEDVLTPVAIVLMVMLVQPIPIYVVLLLLVTVYISRKLTITVKGKGQQWFEEKFLHVLTPVTIIALLVTLVLLFSFKGDMILSNPLTILWIAIPLFIQTNVIFWLGYGLARLLKLNYIDAAPSAMIGASNHFEVAIATSAMLFGLSSGAALATVVGVLIEVPVMLMLVKICLRTQSWFER